MKGWMRFREVGHLLCTVFQALLFLGSIMNVIVCLKTVRFRMNYDIQYLTPGNVTVYVIELDGTLKYSTVTV